MDTAMPGKLDTSSDEEHTDDLLVRDYQQQLLEIAQNQNTILYLPTGSGKTYIAVMLIKAKLDQLEGDIGLGGKRTVFMVNTVPLVMQQATYIARFVPVNVGMYSGDMNVDVWRKSQWDEELRRNKVLVMTCQIFLDMLLHDYISLADTNLLIFDECHHAVEDQPMRQVMTTFQNCNDPPRVLGLTATLLNSSVSLDRVQQTITSLERTFHGTIATVDDMAKVVRFSTNPDEHVAMFQQSEVSLDKTQLAPQFSHMKELLRSLHVCTEEEVGLEQSTPLGSSPIRSVKKEMTSKLVNELDDIVFHLKELGLYGAYKSTIIHNINFIRVQRRARIEEAIICDALLTFCTHIMKIMYDEMIRRYPGGGDLTANHILAFLSPKVLKMLEILRKFNEMVKKHAEEKQNIDRTSMDMFPLSMSKEKPPAMLVFVRRRATAQVLYNIVKDLAKLDKDFEHIHCDYVIGFNAGNYNYTLEENFLKKLNAKVIKRFNMNELNVLFSTSVLEEGIDIPQCSMVIKFDYPENYRSYVQSKGRARHKKSQYYMMVSDIEQIKFSARLKQYRITEQTLQKLLVGRSSARQEPKEAEIESELYEQELEPYYTDGPGSAKVTQVSAISLLNRYCLCLPQDKFTILAPYWYLSNDCRTCFLQLPINCPIKELIQGKAMNSKKMAKRAVALKACEILHKAGELNEHLLPVVSVDWTLGVFEHLLPLWDEEDQSMDSHVPGTRKRKRKYLQKFPEILVECRPQPTHPTYLHVLRLRPKYQRPNPCDNRKLVIYQLLHDTRDFAILSSKPLYQVCQFPIFMNVGELLVEVVTCARMLTLSPQQISAAKQFNTMIFMDLLKVCKPFMVVDNEDCEQSYFVVPAILDGDGLYDVDWDVVSSHTEIPPVTRPPDESRMHTDISRKDLELKVVVPWYRANYIDQFYIVTKVDEKLTTMSDFPTPDFTTFENYFKKKYDLTIFRPQQPLLEVKSISNKIQFLKPRHLGGKSLSKRKRQEQQDDFEEMLVPELCQVFQFPAVLWLKATCLPSVLHRLTYLLLAEELRRCINLGTGIGCVSLPRGHQWQALQVDGTLDVDSTLATTQPSKAHVLATVSSMVKSLSLGPPATEQQPTDIYREDEISVVDVLQYDEYLCNVPRFPQFHMKSTTLGNMENTKELSTDWQTQTMPAVVKEPALQVLDASDDEVGPQLCSIFQAVCTSAANDIVNMERLETLGDSFLKLVVSLYLFSSFPHFDEGKLSQLKGKIVGNRHLFYCGRHIGLPSIMKVHDFAPLSDWIPPGLCVLRSLQESLRLLEVSPNILYDIHVPESEQRAGDMSDELRASVEQQLLAWEGDQSAQSSMEVFLSQRSVSDKAVADCVEALIGAYLQSNGVRCALELVCWLKVLPCEDASPEVLFVAPAPSAKLGEGSVDFHLKAVHLLENQLQYTFKDRAYLLQAVTHPSYISNTFTECYQRLEFIGDAILDFLITGYIYEHCGNLTPGEVTDLRSALVNNVTFASLAARNGFHKFMLFSSVHLMEAINAFVSFQEERNHVVNDDVLLLLTEKDLLMAEAVEVPKALADMFEAIAGAIYLDSQKSLHEVWRVYYRLMENEIQNFSKRIPKQPTRMLHELSPNPPAYLKPSPLENSRMVCVTLELLVKNKKEVFFGFGENKLEGKRAAAKLALRHLFTENAM